MIGRENYSGTRVIRYEENKEAEVFTLVIRGTVENSWFNTSSSGNEYIEINEFELMDVLNYENKDYFTRIAESDQPLFRY